MGDKGVFSRLVPSVLAVLFACGACSVSGGESGLSGGAKASENPEASTDAYPDFPTMDVTFLTNDGGVYLEPVAQGCVQSTTGATFTSENPEGGGSDYVLDIASATGNDCHITSLDVYLIDEHGHRVGAPFSYEGGKFTPFTLKGGKEGYRARASVHFSSDSQAECRHKVDRLELNINRYVRVMTYSEQRSWVCVEQAVGKTVMGDFQRLD